MLQTLKAIRREIKTDFQDDGIERARTPLSPEARQAMVALGLGVTAFIGTWAANSEMSPQVESTTLSFSVLSHLYAAANIAKVAFPNVVSVPAPVGNFLSNHKQDPQFFARRAQRATARGYRAIASLTTH